jgi:hypothetical protein
MLALIQTYPNGSQALLRHWEFFKRSGAEEIWVIVTEDGICEVPEGVVTFKVGRDSYINGHVLPERLINTLEVGLASDHNFIMCCEYDVIFQNAIRYKEMTEDAASCRAGSQTWWSKAKSFYHNPWLFQREFASKFVEEGRKVIAEGCCTRNPGEASTPESSPDVFFGYVCERLNQTVQTDLWTEFSQNSFDIPGTLELAREAYLHGVDVIHGIKTERELHYVLTGDWM